MNVVCRIRKEPFYRREAFEKGLKRVGFTLHEKLRPEGPEDWLVIWNRKRGADETEATQWEARGGTVIVCENGYLQKVDKTTYAISVHQHNGAGWFPVGDDDRFGRLGYALKPWRTESEGSEIVLRLQRGIGSALMASPSQWPGDTQRFLLSHTLLPVRTVPHPGNFAPRVPPITDLARARFFVTWASAMGVLALIEGVPVYYGAPHWICENAATPLSLFPVVRHTSRTHALQRMAHGQWHFEEIATGEPFARIIEHRTEAVW